MQTYSKLSSSILKNLMGADEEKVDILLTQSIKDFNRKIIVLDDDPTGIQTVHDVTVYTDWEELSIRSGFEEKNNMFYILTNSRSFTAEETEKVHQIIAQRVSKIAQETGRQFIIISRSDSTLRGHYPLETETLRNSLQEDNEGMFDGEIICPFFPEGGRYTIGNIHYVKEGEVLVPASMTEFARDKTFGYKSSDLTEYVEEKTKGEYKKKECVCITLEQLRSFQVNEIYQILINVKNYTRIIVNAVTYGDLKVFCVAFIKSIKAGKKFLSRTAAAFPKVVAGISDQPLLTRDMLIDKGEKNGGIVLIGSHIKRTTEQFNYLKESKKDLKFLEFDVNAYFEDGGLSFEVQRIVKAAEIYVKKGKSVVVYTSRKLLVTNTADKDTILKASVEISKAVTSIIGLFSIKPRFIVAKGGITSSDVGTKALKVRRALVMGQIKKGIPVWMTGKESKFPGMPYIIFPGNVGDVFTLRDIVEELM